MSNDEIQDKAYLLPYVHQGLESPLQVLLHTLILIIGWGLYCVLIYYVYNAYDYGVPVLQDFGFIALYTLGCIIVVLVCTKLWIVHNINIYKKKGPRTGSPIVTEMYENDFLGKKIIADLSLMKKANKIVIEIDDDKKQYYTDRN